MAGSASSVTVKLFGSDVSLSSAMAKAAGATGSAATQIQGHGSKIKSAMAGAFGSLSKTGVLGEYQESLAQVGEAVSGLGEKHASMGTKIMTAGGVIAGAGVAMSALASKDQAAQNQLKASIEATGGSYEDYKEEIEKTVKSQEKFGHTADQTQDALSTLTAATDSPTKAIENMGLVANLAAARHESLDAAASQVAKVLAGNGGKTLQQYGVTMKSTGDKTKDGAAAAQLLANKLNGQASAAADTFTGKMDAVKARVTDVASGIAGKLGPALTIAGPALAVVGGAMDLMSKSAKAAGEATEAMGTEAAAGEVEAEAPLLPWIAAIALVAIAAYELYEHWNVVWSSIKTATTAAINFLKNIFTEVITFITSHWKVFAMALATILLGPLGLMIAYVATHLSQVENFFSGAWTKIRSIVTGGINAVKNAVTAGLSAVVSFFAGLPGRILGALASFGSLLVGSGQRLLSGLLSGVTTGGHAVAGWFTSMGSWILGKIGNAGSILFDTGRDLVQGIVDGIGSMGSAIFDKIKSMIPGSGVIGKAASAIGLATGGLVRGPGTSTSDSIPVRLSNGEFVVNAEAASKNMALLRALNAGTNMASVGGGAVMSGASGGSVAPITAIFNVTSNDPEAFAKDAFAVMTRLQKNGYRPTAR